MEAVISILKKNGPVFGSFFFGFAERGGFGYKRGMSGSKSLVKRSKVRPPPDRWELDL
jgi:hypothetical protein